MAIHVSLHASGLSLWARKLKKRENIFKESPKFDFFWRFHTTMAMLSREELFYFIHKARGTSNDSYQESW